MKVSILLLFFVLSACSWPTVNSLVSNRDDALQYLNRFGYNPCYNSSRKSSCAVDDRIMFKEYQRNHRLKITGILDRSTTRKMNSPRCGVSDVRLARSGDIKWSRSSLTWSLRSYPDKEISQTKTKAIIKRAFQSWSAHIPLKITEVCSTCPADFVVEFGADQHNCSDRFYQKVLAHAFLPEEGKIHFNIDHTWSER